MAKQDYQFDFDSMLVKAWIADENKVVRGINRVFREWMKQNRPDEEIVKDKSSSEARANRWRRLADVEKKINSGIPIRDFLPQVLSIDKTTHAFDRKLLDDVVLKINALEELAKGDSFNDENTHLEGITITTEVRDDFKDRRIAGVRAVAIGGIPMPGRMGIEFVDLVIVAQLRSQFGEWRLLATRECCKARPTVRI